MNKTVYTAIFETEKYTLYLAYEPGPDGAIFVTSAEIVAKPVTPFQEREQQRRAGGRFRPSVHKTSVLNP